MRPHGTGEGQRTESDRTQIITCLVLDLSVSLDLGFDPPDHGQVREHRFAWVMPIRCHPVDLMTDRVPAGLDPPCGQVHGLRCFERHIVWRMGEQLLDIGTCTAGQFFFRDMQ